MPFHGGHFVFFNVILKAKSESNTVRNCFKVLYYNQMKEDMFCKVMKKTYKKICVKYFEYVRKKV